MPADPTRPSLGEIAERLDMAKVSLSPTVKTRDVGTCRLCDGFTSSGMNPLCRSCAVHVLTESAAALRQVEQARPLDDWHEDDGPVLWWSFPISEPPFAGTPLDSDWPGYHTHWTPIIVPSIPTPGATR